jgi:cell division protease FtsH
MGLERANLMLTDEEKKTVSYHEAGHALAAARLPSTDPIHKVTIIPRERSLGATQQLPERDRYLYDREYLLDRITVMLGGRAAEQTVLNKTTNGAENDLRDATDLARKMIARWGMSRQLGAFSLADQRDQVFLGESLGYRQRYSESTAETVDAEVKSLLDECYAKAAEIVIENRDILDRIAVRLRENEEMSGDEVLQLVETAAKAGSMEEAGSK